MEYGSECCGCVSHNTLKMKVSKGYCHMQAGGRGVTALYSSARFLFLLERHHPYVILIFSLLVLSFQFTSNKDNTLNLYKNPQVQINISGKAKESRGQTSSIRVPPSYRLKKLKIKYMFKSGESQDPNSGSRAPKPMLQCTAPSGSAWWGRLSCFPATSVPMGLQAGTLNWSGS